MSYKTLKLLVRDKHYGRLKQMSFSVNLVWNYVNELGYKHLIRHGKFLSKYDYQPYTKGASKELNINAQTIQAISEEVFKKKLQFKKPKLRFRCSNSKRSNYTLGWIPFKGQTFKFNLSEKFGHVKYNGHHFRVINSFGDLTGIKVKSGSFVEESDGKWYVCLVIKLPDVKRNNDHLGEIGIDLGLKTAATCSSGKTLDLKVTQQYADKLAIAQRAKNKRRVTAIHKKIRNVRKDAIHKFTTDLVKNNKTIYVGDVNSTEIIKKNKHLAKSVYDASWYEITRQLEYKCKFADCQYKKVNESYSTRTCSVCQSDTGPRGIGGLNVREWKCRVCGSFHKRDINAALNILAIGHNRP